MAATTWVPLTRLEPQRWLLSNGEIVSEPALEATSTGRKVRVAGTTSSVFSGELNQLLTQAAQNVAIEKGATIWLALPNEDLGEELKRHATNFNGTNLSKSALHLIHEPTEVRGQTVCWWRFKDPDSIFEVLLVAQLVRMNASNSAQQMNIRAWIPGPTTQAWENNFQIHQVSNPGFTETLTAVQGHPDRYEWQEFLRDNKVAWPEKWLGSQHFSHARAAVTKMLAVVRDFEELDSIEVPDYSDPSVRTFRRLDLYDTNVSGELVNELTEYLDNAPTVDQAGKIYEELIDLLQSTGIQVGKKLENDFMAALLAGEKETLNIEVHGIADSNIMGVDTSHRLSVHLPTGTFIVECDHAHVNRNEVAEKWEEAVTMASLTGQESELLAYAKAYAADRIKKRTSSILKERSETV